MFDELGDTCGCPACSRDVEDALLAMSLRLQRTRARIEGIIPRAVRRDSTWDMLLELFSSRREGRSICVKDLILVSGESATSALRRIDRLEAAGLIERRQDRDDFRRVAMALTPAGEGALATMLVTLFHGDQCTRLPPAAEGAGPVRLPHPASFPVKDFHSGKRL